MAVRGSGSQAAIKWGRSGIQTLPLALRRFPASRRALQSGRPMLKIICQCVALVRASLDGGLPRLTMGPAMQIPSIQEDAAKWAPVLKKICWYVVLASADSDQVTLLNTTAADKKLAELPDYKGLLQTFIVKEVPSLPVSCAGVSTEKPAVQTLLEKGWP